MKGAVLLAVTVIATGFGTQYDADWPPTRFRGVGTTLVTYVSTQAEIDKLCGKAPNGQVTEACVTPAGVEVFPDPCGYQGEYARIGCHENAHRFRAWPVNHPK